MSSNLLLYSFHEREIIELGHLLYQMEERNIFSVCDTTTIYFDLHRSTLTHIYNVIKPHIFRNHLLHQSFKLTQFTENREREKKTIDTSKNHVYFFEL